MASSQRVAFALCAVTFIAVLVSNHADAALPKLYSNNAGRFSFMCTIGNSDIQDGGTSIVLGDDDGSVAVEGLCRFLTLESEHGSLLTCEGHYSSSAGTQNTAALSYNLGKTVAGVDYVGIRVEPHGAVTFFFASDAVGDAQVGTPFTRKAAPTGDKGNAFNHAIEDYGTISDDSGSITCRARLEYFYTKGAGTCLDKVVKNVANGSETTFVCFDDGLKLIDSNAGNQILLNGFVKADSSALQCVTGQSYRVALGVSVGQARLECFCRTSLLHATKVLHDAELYLCVDDPNIPQIFSHEPVSE